MHKSDVRKSRSGKCHSYLSSLSQYGRNCDSLNNCLLLYKSKKKIKREKLIEI